jgi:hypothetical protein
MLSRVPPLPYPLERLDWRGFRKKCLQNLEGKGLTRQNLENKRLMAFLVLSVYTASALTIICQFSVEDKVICHKRGCA